MHLFTRVETCRIGDMETKRYREILCDRERPNQMFPIPRDREMYNAKTDLVHDHSRKGVTPRLRSK